MTDGYTRASARRQVAIASSRCGGDDTGRRRLNGPGVELERPVAPGRQRRVEHVERVERLDPVEQEVLREAVQRAAGEAAGIDGAALLDEGAELLVDRHVAGERLVATFGNPRVPEAIRTPGP